MLTLDVAAGILLACFILTVSFEALVGITIGAGVAAGLIVGLIWVVIFSINLWKSWSVETHTILIALPVIAFLTLTLYDQARDLSAHQSGQHKEYDPTCSLCRTEHDQHTRRWFERWFGKGRGQ